MSTNRQGSFGRTAFYSLVYGFAALLLLSRILPSNGFYETGFSPSWLLAPVGAFCGFIGATCVHEFAHFFAARIVGCHVVKIQIGSGKLLGTFRIMGTACELHESLRSGLVAYRLTSAKGARFKLAITTGAAPLASLLLAIVSVVFLLYIYSLQEAISSVWDYSLAFVAGWTMPCVLFLPGVLLPYSYHFAGRRMKTDALVLLTIPWITDAEIAAKLAASERIAAGTRIDPSTSSG
jgi:hypothetical protein